MKSTIVSPFCKSQECKCSLLTSQPFLQEPRMQVRQICVPWTPKNQRYKSECIPKTINNKNCSRRMTNGCKAPSFIQIVKTFSLLASSWDSEPSISFFSSPSFSSWLRFLVTHCSWEGAGWGDRSKYASREAGMREDMLFFKPLAPSGPVKKTIRAGDLWLIILLCSTSTVCLGW